MKMILIFQRVYEARSSKTQICKSLGKRFKENLSKDKGNNPVCRWGIKEATAVNFALKDKKCLNKNNEIVINCIHMKNISKKVY